ncbi:MAG: WbqC family protein [candidate division WOR-3 bacterium]
MNVVIMQPFYLFLRKHFHQVYRADTYVFYDDVQFVKGHHHNRNRIKGPNGLVWLTVPVFHRFGQKILEVRIDNKIKWRENHLKSIISCYSRAPFFKDYIGFFEDCYSRNWEFLCDLNIYLIINISKLLGITKTNFVRSSELKVYNENPTQRLIDICEKLNATNYIIGIRAKDYMEEVRWKKTSVHLEWFEPKYPPYPQLWGDFQDNCAIIDLLFNCGPESGEYIWGKYFEEFNRNK